MLIPSVVFMTDFGLKDPFVGCMHAVFACICPQGRIIDLTHLIEPQAVDEAGYILEDAYRYFPQKSLFVCVVDPGVGTSRPILFVDTENYYFLIPDNGVLTRVLKAEKIIQIYRVENKDLFLNKDVSATFHGRDIFAPVAAHLSNGIDFKKLGPVTDSIMRLDISEPELIENYILCKIIGFDRFGNALTDYKFKSSSNSVRLKHAELAGKTIPFSEGVYLDFTGQFFAHKNSFDRVEIALGMGSAQAVMNLKKGVPVKLFYEKR